MQLWPTPRLHAEYQFLRQFLVFFDMFRIITLVREHTLFLILGVILLRPNCIVNTRTTGRTYHMRQRTWKPSSFHHSHLGKESQVPSNHLDLWFGMSTKVKNKQKKKKIKGEKNKVENKKKKSKLKKEKKRLVYWSMGIKTIISFFPTFKWPNS